MGGVHACPASVRRQSRRRQGRWARPALRLYAPEPPAGSSQGPLKTALARAQVSVQRLSCHRLLSPQPNRLLFPPASLSSHCPCRHLCPLFCQPPWIRELQSCCLPGDMCCRCLPSHNPRLPGRCPDRHPCLLVCCLLWMCELYTRCLPGRLCCRHLLSSHQSLPGRCPRHHPRPLVHCLPWICKLQSRRLPGHLQCQSMGRPRAQRRMDLRQPQPHVDDPWTCIARPPHVQAAQERARRLPVALQYRLHAWDSG